MIESMTQRITVRATESINRLFLFKNDISSITSCDANDATFRTVNDLIFASTDDKNCNFVKSSLKMCTVLCESALCNRAEDDVNRDRRELRFRLTICSDIRSELKSQSTSPCAEI